MRFLQVRVLVLDALALEARERAEPQVEDRLRLDLGELEAASIEPLAGLVGVRRTPRISAITASRLSSAIR